MTMIFVPGFDMLGSLAAREGFELREGRALDRFDVATRELDAGHRRVTAGEREQRRADAAHVVVLRLDACLDRLGDGADDAVGEQDAEEGADERACDLLADLRRGAA